MRNVLIAFVVFMLPLQAFSQIEKYLQEDPEPTAMRQWGVAFSILESGTGLGGFIGYPVKGYIHLGGTLNIFLLRDSKEFQFYGYTFGRKNNVYLIDLMLTAKKRLFAREIDDSFRPFIALSAGPVYGMNFPESNEIKDQFRWAASGAIATGIDAALSGNYLFGLRLQYRFLKFDDVLGEKQNHSMFDVRIEIGKRF